MQAQAARLVRPQRQMTKAVRVANQACRQGETYGLPPSRSKSLSGCSLCLSASAYLKSFLSAARCAMI